jgi:hypothetical protein
MAATLDIALLRSEIRQHLGVSDADPKWNDDAIDLLANRAFWAVMNKYPFQETKKTALFSTVIGERSYDLPILFEAVRQVSLVEPVTEQHLYLRRMSIFNYEQKYNESVDSRGTPTHYLRDGGCIILYPTPDAVVEIVLKHWILLDQLDDTNTDFALPANWFEIIMYGAVQRGFLRARNTAESVNLKNLQASAISDTQAIDQKEAEDTRFYGLEIIGYDPDEIYS